MVSNWKPVNVRLMCLFLFFIATCTLTAGLSTRKSTTGRHYVKCEGWKLRLACCLNLVRGSSSERRNRNEQPTSFSSSHLKRQGMLVHHISGLFRNLVMLECDNVPAPDAVPVPNGQYSALTPKQPKQPLHDGGDTSSAFVCV